MLKNRPKELVPERKNPGDREPTFGSPGSIEQQLDMCEEGTLRGDEILHHHGLEPVENKEGPIEIDRLMENNYHMDLAEDDREGAEMSGDEHSIGLQGGDSELANQAHIATGLPGDRAHRTELLEGTDQEDEEDRQVPIVWRPKKALKANKKKVG
jgi:hypothetical protein